MWLDTGIVLAYIVLLIVMSLRGGRNVHNAADFTASGGRYGTLVVFATLSASYVGGGYSSGNAAKAFAGGIGTTLTLFGFSLAMLLIGRFLVPGVERFPQAKTVGGIVGTAYGRSARVLTGFFAFLCCAGVVGAQMEAIGLVFHVLLGVESHIGILLGCGIVLLYTTFGGLQSVIVADILQFVLLAGGMPLLLFMGLREAGGIDAVLSAVPAEYFNPFNGTTAAGFFSLFLTMMFGEALAPPYTQRLLIGRNARDTARATILSGLFSIPFFIVTGMIGLTAYTLQVTGDAASAMPALVQAVLPVGLRGVVMAAMVSIILSAADGFLNGAAVSLVCDALMPLRPGLCDRAQLWLLRGVNLATGIGAMLLAFVVPDIFRILVLAYSFWSPLILVPLAAALLGVKSNGRAFRCALLAGLAATLLWNYPLGKPWDIDGSVVGILCNFIVFALCTRALHRYQVQQLQVWKPAAPRRAGQTGWPARFRGSSRE